MNSAGVCLSDLRPIRVSGIRTGVIGNIWRNRIPRPVTHSAFWEKMADPRGFEPLASAFGGQRSIQLS